MTNFICQEKDKKEKIRNLEVQFVAVSPSGLRLATTEYRRDKTSHEQRIKFWSFKPDSQQ